MFNKDEAIKKGLIINDDDSKYKLVYSNYKYLLEYYISTKIDFNKYEKMIKESNLFIGINDKYKVINNYLKLDYFFVFNRLFVEKLDVNDINLLLILNKDNIDSNLLNMIERTYKDIIKDNYNHINKSYVDSVFKVNYGNDLCLDDFTDNDSIVIKLIYGKNTKDFDTNEFIEINKKQIDFLKNIASAVKTDFKDYMGVKCDVIIKKEMF